MRQPETKARSQDWCVASFEQGCSTADQSHIHVSQKRSQPSRWWVAAARETAPETHDCVIERLPGQMGDAGVFMQVDDKGPSTSECEHPCKPSPRESAKSACRIPQPQLPLHVAAACAPKTSTSAGAWPASSSIFATHVPSSLRSEASPAGTTTITTLSPAVDACSTHARTSPHNASSVELSADHSMLPLRARLSVDHSCRGVWSSSFWTSLEW